jgi:1-phosphofructokinase
MIYTCTTNPSLDYYITLPEIKKGAYNRTDMEMFDAGGKGVNVSIVLNNFRIPSVALGFLGGFAK